MSQSPELPQVSLRAAGPSDRFRIRRWLAEPAVAGWWGNAASAEAEMTLAMQSASALCRLILVDGEAAGYAQAVEVGAWGSELPPGPPSGSFVIDVFVASEHRGRGLGHLAIDLIVDEVFETTLAVACCIFASIRNEAAVRACERAGFKWSRIAANAARGPCWVLIRRRPAS